MIPNEFIDELLQKVDIIDVIDEFVPLKKAGQNYVACCPFHKEKSPSFSVSPTKQFYHCFGCGAHGSAISFVMEYQGLSFIESVQYIADRIGMKVPHSNNTKTFEQQQQHKKQQQTLEEITASVATFYQQQLQLAAEARNYLLTRGLNDDVIATYGLGFAPNDWQALAKIFNPYPNHALIQSGMVIEKDDKHYDRFRNRIIFPICDQRGRVIGFGGRVMDKTTPKYLNSPETPLFEKGKHLYGLYEARQGIRDSNRVLVVEGYMDVVSLAQFGIHYAVAALGTATTAQHIQLLMRQSDDIYFCFDGDDAGRKAAWRAVENALPYLKDDKALHFLFLPKEHDPDSYIRAYGRDAFEDALQHKSITLSHYFWQALSDTINLETQEGKAELIKRSGPLLTQIKAPALSYLLRQTLSEMVHVDEHNLAYLLGQEQPKQHIQQKNYHLPKQTFRQPEIMTLVQQQIRALLINPQWAVYIDLPEYLDLHGDYACLAALAERIQASTVPINSSTALELMRQTEFEPIIKHIFQTTVQTSNILMADSQEECEAFKQGMQKILDTLKLKQIDALKQKLHQGELNASEKKLLLTLLHPNNTLTPMPS